MKRRLLPFTALLCLLFFLAQAQKTDARKQTSPAAKTTGTVIRTYAPPIDPAGISKRVFPLQSVLPGYSFSDLAPLKKGLSGVSIFGAGEGTHGTHEFFTFKHRLFEFLVQEMDYTVFAIEDGMYGAALINQYITAGQGDPKAILEREFHNVFQVRELLDLIEWMRGYNAAHGNRLTFAGFDSQQMDSYVRGIREIEDSYQTNSFRRLTDYSAPEGDTAGQAMIEARAIAESMAENIPVRPPHVPEKAWEQATWYLLNIKAALQQFTSKDWLPAINTRDSMMALNVQRLAAQHQGEKIMLWAHNGHVGSRHGAVDGFNTLGSHLKARYGAAYQNLGFTTSAGTFRAMSETTFKMVEDNRLSIPVTGSIESLLHKTGIPLFFFSTRSLPLEGRFRMIGSIAYKDQFTPKPVKLGELFDWLVFVDKTSCALGL